MIFALIKNNIVENIAVADQEWADTILTDWQYVIDITDVTPQPGPLWSYDGHAFEPDPPPPAPPPEPINWKITRLAFRNRFTSSEKVAVELGCLDNPEGTLQQRQQAAMLRSMQKDVDAAVYIDLKNQDTRNGVQALETAGLLASGRALQILDTNPIRIEVYTGTAT